jgi:hypothetical protein
MDHLHLSGAAPSAENAAHLCLECEERSIQIRGRCGRCYRRWRLQLIKSGSFVKAPPAVRPLRERLLEKTTPGPGGCVIWTASLNNRGYGKISEGGKGGKDIYAHRAAYTLFVGPIPDGLVIDHTCHNRDAACSGGPDCLHRRCINPHHLEAITPEENIKRSAASSSNWTTCVNGHPFDESNTYIRPDKGSRQCKQCGRDRRAVARAGGAR